MGKSPVIKNEYNDFETLQKRMKGTKKTEIATQSEFNLIIDNDEPLEKKEEKIIIAAKAKKFSEYFMMRMIGMIYTEGQWFTKWIIVDGKRESAPGDYNDEIEYMTHLAEITGFSKRYLQNLVGLYRIFKKHEKYLESIHYETIGHIGKIYYLDKAMEMVESKEITKHELTKILTTKSEAELAEMVEKKAIPVNDDFRFEASARISVKNNVVYIDDQPTFQILNNESDSLRKNLLTFVAAEQKKTSLGDNFKEAAELYQKRLMDYISDEKIPVIIPVDSDISDVKAFQRAAEKAMQVFYKNWKIEH